MVTSLPSTIAAGAYCDNLCNLGLLLRGACQHDAALCGLFCFFQP